MTTQFNHFEIQRITQESQEGFPGFVYSDLVLLIDELIPQCRELLGEQNLAHGFALLEVVCQAMSHAFSKVYKSFEISQLKSFQGRLEQFNDLLVDMMELFDFDDKLANTVKEFEGHTIGRLDLLTRRIEEVEKRSKAPLISPTIIDRTFRFAP